MTEHPAPDDHGREASAGIGEAGGWIGSKLDDLGGQVAGRISGLLIDAVDGSPVWLIARLGRFGKHAAVPVEYAAGGAGRVWVPFPREMIRAAASIDPGAGLSCGEERALAATYGAPERGGRLEVIAGRTDEEPGSVPAS